MEPGVPKRVQRGGSYLCSDLYCTRYLPGSRGKGAVDSGASHVGFRCVRRPGAAGAVSDSGPAVGRGARGVAGSNRLTGRLGSSRGLSTAAPARVPTSETLISCNAASTSEIGSGRASVPVSVGA